MHVQAEGVWFQAKASVISVFCFGHWNVTPFLTYLTHLWWYSFGRVKIIMNGLLLDQVDSQTQRMTSAHYMFTFGNSFQARSLWCVTPTAILSLPSLRLTERERERERDSGLLSIWFVNIVYDKERQMCGGLQVIHFSIISFIHHRYYNVFLEIWQLINIYHFSVGLGSCTPLSFLQRAL